MMVTWAAWSIPSTAHPMYVRILRSIAPTT